MNCNYNLQIIRVSYYNCVSDCKILNHVKDIKKGGY